jgi:hypothetical protein
LPGGLAAKPVFARIRHNGYHIDPIQETAITPTAHARDLGTGIRMFAEGAHRAVLGVDNTATAIIKDCQRLVGCAIEWILISRCHFSPFQMPFRAAIVYFFYPYIILTYRRFRARKIAGKCEKM